MSVKIYDTDSPYQIALKIYKDFEVLNSCTIYGFYMDEAKQKLIPKGEIIMDLIKDMYESEYIDIKEKTRHRKFKYRNNSVGGPISHPIFTFEKRIVDMEPRYTIWRFQ